MDRKAYMLLSLLILLLPAAGQADVVLSEIMAINDSTLADEDGDFPDWVEIWNRGVSSVNLDGWHLSDDATALDKWTFPAEILEADSVLIIFASQKDRSVTGAQLHTNFRLSGDGEYLALVEPDGFTIASQFAPAFPELGSDESFGITSVSTSIVTLVSLGAMARSTVPADGSLGTNWTTLGGVDDSAWREGATGVGYDTQGNFDPYINTDVQDLMFTFSKTCYIRIPFYYQPASALDGVSLEMRYDDGFVAYLNGGKIGSRNAPATPQWNSEATGEKDDASVAVAESIQIVGAEALLTPGTNLLAIHGLNWQITPLSGNFLIAPGLTGIGIVDSLEILPGATPGLVNTDFSPPIDFVPAGGTFTTPPTVTLSTDPPGAPIYYTLDGSQPTTNASLYGSPIALPGSTQIRARSIESGDREGPIRSEGYIVMAADLLLFSSDLPLVVIENFGAGDAGQSLFRPFHLGIFEPQGGRTSLTNLAVLATRAGVRKRGSSSINRDKVSYNVEAWSEQDEDKTISPLGMPEESDWILYGPYNFDRAMIRNAFIYEISKQAGRYAVRTRFVELFRNIDGGALSYADDYRGVYVWMEKIKRDRSRVDIDKISPTDVAEPEITGGYMIKVDRADPGDSGFTAGGITLRYVDPKESEMETTHAAQAAWLQNYIDQFGLALNGTNFMDPDTGYTAYLDQGTVIDYFILNEFMTRNPDGAWASMYMFKPRAGKLMYGPIWDFDRTMGCADDGRSANPTVWTTDNVWNLGWWSRLFDDANLWQGMIDRWHALRGDVLSLSNILSVVDSQSAELQEAEARNFTKWTGVPPRGGTYEAEVDLLRIWLSNRVEWVDSQFLESPVIVPGSGVVAPGELLTLSGPAGTTIYYTLDGSDPRAPGGAPASGATLYGGPFSLFDDTVVVARAWDGQSFGEPQTSAPWSPTTRAIYVFEAAELALTEVMYNPRQASTNDLTAGLTAGDFEFIELQHTGTETGSLLGVSFTDGIGFDFTTAAVTSLAPGEHVILVRNLDAFTNRYPGWTSMNIAGEFTGSLNNDGEPLAVASVITGELWRITYDDRRGWPVAADGAGHSLVPLHDKARLLDYGGNWRSSAYIDGSPGADDPDLPVSVVLNEFMAHTDFTNPALPEYDSDDWIELYHAGTNSVSLADWYLSDNAGDLAKWAIPASNVVMAGSWLSFDEVTGFHNPITDGFGLDKTGERIFLSHLPGNSADRVVDAVRFKGQERTASLGRYGDAGDYWRAMDLTRDTTNALPHAHPVISEIMYHPASTNAEDNTRDEFVEVLNPLDTAVALWTEAGTWRLAGGINFAFPTNTMLSPRERILLLSFDPGNAAERDGFLALYGLTNGQVRLFGPYVGFLSDRGERVALERPQAPDIIGDPVSWVIVEEAIYYDRSPWAIGADGTGQSLQRTDTAGAARYPANWIALAATPGSGSKLVITAPPNEAPYFLPADLDVVTFLDVSQVTGTVQEVRFYHGTNRFATDSSAPYEAALSYAGPPGTVNLSAEAQGSAGVITSQTLRIIAQTLDNAQGARDITDYSAVLRGRLMGGGVAEATFAWGTVDGGTNRDDWAHVQNVGTVGTGTFELVVANLHVGTGYTYRVHAVNANGETWAPTTATFATTGYNQWRYCMNLDFGGPASGITFTNFPVLIRLHDGLTNFSYGQFASATGNDLRFSGTHDEVLPYEIDRWDTNGVSTLWLLVPALTNGTQLRALWGAAQAAAAPPPFSGNGAVWAGGYQAVWHLESDLVDATLNGSTITDEGSSNTPGIVSGGLNLNGSDNALRLALSESWYAAHLDAMTISLWVRPAEIAGSTVFSTDGPTNLYAFMNTTPFFRSWFTTLDGSGVAGEAYDADQWQLLSFVFETGRVSLAKNDGGLTDAGDASGLSFVEPPAIGVRLGFGSQLAGGIDDVRISEVAHTAEWIAAEYATVAKHESFLTYGPVLTKNDLDQDRLPDVWEEENLGSTNAAADADTDWDGMDNEGEYLAGTDPTNAASVFAIDVVPGNGQVTVHFMALEAVGPGYEGLERYYDLLSSSNLLLQQWPSVIGFSNILGQGQLVTHTSALPHPSYFRARTHLE